MSRRLPPLLRTWSGVLLACALFACLSGLARPAMAMPGLRQMPASASHAAAMSVAAESPHHGPGCPGVSQQCEAPKGALVQDGPANHVPAPAPQAMACSPASPTAQPNAPPPSAAPPDLHRLCVSRT